MTNTLSTTTRVIHDGWRFRDIPVADTSPDLSLPWLPAKVPGHVHLDLLEAGVITDPFHRMAEKSAAWIDHKDWQYETLFHLDEAPSPHTLLRFEGLDTIAEITVNGELIAATDNMTVAHELIVGDRLRFGSGVAGDNSLQVVFRSALNTGIARRAEWHRTSGDTLTDEWYRFGPQSFVRKAQYMYGWDWGPVLLSCGIWQPVKLVQVPIARLLDVSYTTAFHDDGSASVEITHYVERAPNAGDAPLRLEIAWTGVSTIDGVVEAPMPGGATVDVPIGSGRVAATAVVKIDDAQKWWPNRHNPEGSHDHPVLYTVEATLTGTEKLDARATRIGLRTVELIREADTDGAGECFKFRVNGHNIFIRGANWIPADSFPSRLETEPGKTSETPEDSDARVHNLIYEVCEAGYNMLRIWGGGLYESEHFYELCDEHGILVWQDFLYACAYYPDTGAYADAAREEAVAAIRRLRSHPSLAMWCGNNENLTMFHDNWGNLAPSRYLGEKIYDDVLPQALAQEDPERPYWPSSPSGGDDPNSPDWGDRHNWDVWHGVGDWKNYANDRARFASEFGFASSCSVAAWDSCLEEEDWGAHTPAVRWHDKTRKGYDTYIGLIGLHYPELKTLEDLVYYSQLNQADALSFGIEHYRRLKGRCWGTLFWQINDCWPTQSWAVIDSLLEPKAAFYASKRFYAPLLLSLALEGDKVSAHLVNDRLSGVTGTLVMQLRTFSGDVVAEIAAETGVEANAATRVAELPLGLAAGRERELYVSATFCETDDKDLLRAQLFLAEPKDLLLPDPGLKVTIGDEDRETLHVKLETEELAAAVWLHVDSGLESPPEFSDNFFTIEPGETVVVYVSKTETASDPVALQDNLKIRTLAVKH